MMFSSLMAMRSSLPAMSLYALTLAGAACTPALAQTAAQDLKLGPVVLHGSIRSRVEFWNWFEGDADNSYAFSGNLARLAFSQAGKRFDWQIELAAPILLGLPENAVAPGTQGQLGLGANYYVSNDRSRNAAMVFPKQAFVRIKQSAHALRLGRFEFNDGTETAPEDVTIAWLKRERISQRLIGTFGFTHVGRSFDGGHYTWNSKNTNVTVLGVLPTRGVFQVDGWGNLHVGLGYAALTRSYSSKRHHIDARGFGIYYQDWRHIVKTDNRPSELRNSDLANIRIGSFGGHYLHRITTGGGPLDFLVWGVGQTGRWGRLDHRATAIAAEAGWQPPGMPALRPWLRAGYFHGSGDDNPLDNRHGTFFQILPTPRPYARFPFFDFLNNEDFMGMLLLRPHSAITIRTEVHGLRLASGSDLWYLGGGAFQPWTFGYIGRATGGNRGLATLYDAGVDYNVNPQLTVSGYFAHAQGHSVMQAIYPRGRNANFGYLELNYHYYRPMSQSELGSAPAVRKRYSSFRSTLTFTGG